MSSVTVGSGLPPRGPWPPLTATAEGNTADFRRLVCEMPDPAWVLDGERVVCASRTLCQLLRHSDPGALADMPGSTLESHLMTPSGQSRIRLLAADGSTSTVELHRSARVGLSLEVMRPVEASVGLGVDVLEGLTSQLLEGTDTSISKCCGH